jgi:hypothetical protein
MSDAQTAGAACAENDHFEEWEAAAFEAITSSHIDEATRALLATPPRVYPLEESVLAIHWHPEFVPVDLIRARISKTFPGRRQELIIPTQHNVLMSWDGYAGVEVDCYSPEFKRKVQILLHFKEERLERADTLKKMLDHTFRYRSGQLFEFLDSLIEARFEDRRQEAARVTSVDAELVAFVRAQAERLRLQIRRVEATLRPEAVKNRLVKDWFDKLRDRHDGALIDRAQIFVRKVKAVVKRRFDNTYFYETRQVIDEARQLGAGVVVPHPEQFWPILLADYDIDGLEVWNPGSRDYTEFLIQAVHRLNQRRERSDRPILVTMGDDCHMGEKAKDPRYQDADKLAREVGVLHAWDDLAIRKQLILYDIDRRRVIEAYKERLV